MSGKSELIVALEQIEREKGIRKDDVLKMIEGAMVSSLRKHVGKNTIIEASIDPKTADFKAFIIKKVVEKPEDSELEISLEAARRSKKDAVLGEDIRLPAPAGDFARIAAQTAKQVLVQKIREVERDSLYNEYKPKEGEVVNGSVQRFMDRNLIVDLGKTEAILPLREQIRRERYTIGSRVRAIILKVDKAQRGPQVLLSRSAPLYLRRLFELEVPEINDKIVEIVEIVRDPGFRAKVVVKSNDANVDAVGSCVGLRGSRIRSIMSELSGERIDLVPFSAEIDTFIGNTLVPAKVSKVTVVDMEARRAEIVVPDEQLSLAIGKDGQNVRLACRLTGWSLEVKSESQKRAEDKPAKTAKSAKSGAGAAISDLEGVGPKTAATLVEGGFDDPYRLAQLTPEELTAKGIGEKMAIKVIKSAKAFVKATPKTA